MTDFEEMLRDMIAGLFADLSEQSAQETTETRALPRDIWARLVEAGLTSAADPVSETPQMLPLQTLAIIARGLGAHALPLPLAEAFVAQRAAARTDLALAGEVLSLSGSVLSLAATPAGYVVSGQLRRVAWGGEADAILAQAQDAAGQSYLVRLPQLTPDLPDTSLAGEPRDSFTLRDLALSADAVARDADPARLVQEMRLMRSAMMIGAMDAALAMTITYAKERVQFGRPIAKYQAVQHQIAELAAQVASATASTEAALAAADRGEAEFEVLCAKIRCNEAAGICAKVAHQVHGAMGITHEHRLHYFTRRLWSWRDEYGTESDLSVQLGRRVVAAGAGALWPQIAGGADLSSSAMAAQ